MSHVNCTPPWDKAPKKLIPFWNTISMTTGNTFRDTDGRIIMRVASIMIWQLIINTNMRKEFYKITCSTATRIDVFTTNTHMMTQTPKSIWIRGSTCGLSVTPKIMYRGQNLRDVQKQDQRNTHIMETGVISYHKHCNIIGDTRTRWLSCSSVEQRTWGCVGQYISLNCSNVLKGLYCSLNQLLVHLLIRFLCSSKDLVR